MSKSMAQLNPKHSYTFFAEGMILDGQTDEEVYQLFDDAKSDKIDHTVTVIDDFTCETVFDANK